MAKKFIGIFCVLLGSIAYSQPVIDVQHYKYEFGLTDESDIVKGRATITVKFLRPSDTLSFDFVTKNKGNTNMTVSLTMPDPSRKAQLKVISPKLYIKMNRPANDGDSVSFIIDFKGVPFDGLIISKNKF